MCFTTTVLHTKHDIFNRPIIKVRVQVFPFSYIVAVTNVLTPGSYVNPTMYPYPPAYAAIDVQPEEHAATLPIHVQPRQATDTQQENIKNEKKKPDLK